MFVVGLGVLVEVVVGAAVVGVLVLLVVGDVVGAVGIGVGHGPGILSASHSVLQMAMNMQPSASVIL